MDRNEATPRDAADAHSFARCGASTRLARASCCVCRRAFSNGSACYVDQTNVKLKRFHLWCKQRPAALDGVEAQTVPGFASLSATAKEAVRAWLQAPAEQSQRREESERPGRPMAMTRVHPPPTDDSVDGSGATVREIAAAATSAVPAPDAAAADDHGDGASTWIPPQRKRKRDYHVDAKESSHRQWKAFGSDPTRRSMLGIRTVRILHARALLTRMQLEMYRGDRPAALRLLATLLREFIHLRAALAQAGFELLSSSANEHGQVLRFGPALGAAWRCARQTKPLHLATARSLLDAAPCRQPDPARDGRRGGSGLRCRRCPASAPSCLWNPLSRARHRPPSRITLT